jgi:plasmid stabilization system protein ParE
MIVPVVLRHQAAEELLAACEYLEARQAGLSVRLIQEVRRVCDRISTHPELHGKVLRDIRRAAVRRFPYSVFYRVTADRLEVLAVFHDSRDPAAWQNRT